MRKGFLTNLIDELGDIEFYVERVINKHYNIDMLPQIYKRLEALRIEAIEKKFK